MAYIASAFTAGQTLTAASMEQLRENTNYGHNVFTTEAVRDAAITSPVEGMMAYLTASTVATAAGGTTFIPTGVTTVYNGSAWVCVTSVGAHTDTLCSTTGTSMADPTSAGGTNPTVTLSTGTTALITIGADGRTSTTANQSYMGVAVSGASTIAASLSYAVSFLSSGYQSVGRTFMLSGLTAGTNTFTLKYQTTGGLTGYYQYRNISVQGIA